jgi:hypothetical protein
MSISSQFFSELTIYIYIALFFLLQFSFVSYLLLQVSMYIYKTLSRILHLHFTSKQPRRKGEISYLIFLIKF